VALLNAWLIVVFDVAVPFPLAPITPFDTIVHVYVLPLTFDDIVNDVFAPEQILDAAGVTVNAGVGFTVILYVTGCPGQFVLPLVVAVTI
jgi:hypothetical protein